MDGDWGLGIGPNPQSPIPNPQIKIQYATQIKVLFKIIFKIILIMYK